MPTRDDQQVGAVVGELLAEGDLHQLRARRSASTSATSAGEAGDRRGSSPGPRRGSRRSLSLVAGAEAGEVGEEAGRDRLEELQRRPGDHQHVEDEARRRGAREARDQQRPGVEEGLLAEHDQEARRPRSRRPRASVNSTRRGGSGGRRSRGRGRRSRAAARRRKANGTTISERVGAATIPSATAVWPLSDAEGDRERERPSARPTR